MEAVGVNDDDAEGEELKSILLCRQYLLEAGCDPTIPTTSRDGEEEGHRFEKTLASCVPVRLPI